MRGQSGVEGTGSLLSFEHAGFGDGGSGGVDDDENDDDNGGRTPISRDGSVCIAVEDTWMRGEELLDAEGPK
jgi:hypothetical protein